MVLNLKGDDTGWLIGEQQLRLQEYDGPLDVVLDIGAHVGTFCCAAVEKGAKLVIAMEPDPANFRSLVENVAVNGMQDSIVMLPFAAHTQDFQQLTLRAASGNSGQRSLVFNKAWGGSQVWSIDLWRFIIQDLSPYAIDYLKMDIEGGEWSLLNGSEWMFAALNKVNYINMEGHPLSNIDYFEGDEGDALRNECEARLKSLFDVRDYGPQRAPVWRGWRKGLKQAAVA